MVLLTPVKTLLVLSLPLVILVLILTIRLAVSILISLVMVVLFGKKFARDLIFMKLLIMDLLLLWPMTKNLQRMLSSLGMKVVLGIPNKLVTLLLWSPTLSLNLVILLINSWFTDQLILILILLVLSFFLILPAYILVIAKDTKILIPLTLIMNIGLLTILMNSAY